MRYRFYSGIFAAVISVFWLQAMSAAQTVDNSQTIERKFKLSGRPILLVRNSAGQTKITGGDKGQIIVRAVKEVRRLSGEEEIRRAAASVEVRIERQGNRIEVEVRNPERPEDFFGSEPRVLVHLEITAPRASDIDAQSTSGTLELAGFDGKLDLGTAAGELTATYCSGRMDLRTKDGNLAVRDARGEVSAATDSGRVNVDGILQALNVQSGDARTEISIKPGSKMEKNWSIRSGDGDILLALPAGFSADVDATTDSGVLEANLPITLGIGTSERRLVGKLYQGRHALRIRTAGGDIKLQ